MRYTEHTHACVQVRFSSTRQIFVSGYLHLYTLINIIQFFFIHQNLGKFRNRLSILIHFDEEMCHL